MEINLMKFQFLGHEGVQKIHAATIQILSETGIVLTHSKARALLRDHGATINKDRVLLPEDLIEKCLEKVPASVKLEGRDPDRAIELRNGPWYAHNVGGVPNVFDPRFNNRRPATREDVVQSTRLLDALPNADSVTPLFTPQDVDPQKLTLWMAFDTLVNTTKPLRAPGVQTGKEVVALAEMFEISCPNGVATVGISPISPLTFPDEIVEAIFEAANNSFVLGPLPCPILGATAPMSVAGGLAQQNAEVLATVVLGQLMRSGTAAIYKGRLSVMEPRTGLSVWGNPEIGMISAGTTEIGHYYKMPVDVYGLCTNSHTIDIQSGYERALNAIIPVLSGAEEISGIGEMDGGVNASLAQIVIDDEILSSMRRITASFDVNDDTLAVDLIASVMDGPVNFLAEKHTVQFLRSGEILKPGFALRDTWSQWEDGGRTNLIDRAQDSVEHLMSNHEVPRLDENQLAAMKEVIQLY
jgi:trimethylamine--corrinoid protein Co-methyltransferase